MGMVFIKNFPNRLFAEQAAQSLEQAGIPCVITTKDYGITGSGSNMNLEGVDLHVDEEDAEEAREMLSALYDGI